MPRVTDTPPEAIRTELIALRDDLDAKLPSKALDRNLLIATWNLRAFGDLTPKWESSEDDSPKRDWHALRCIAEIVAHFDVIALQEVRANLKALRHMLRVLGPAWSFLMTDVTKGSAGNGERMAFLFDTRKVRLSGLASELVVPQEQMQARHIDSGALDRQFARTPYAVSFQAEHKTFILTTLHVLYGDDPAGRIPELRAIAGWLAEWARDINTWDHNLIALGDFNIDRHGDALYDAFTSTGLEVPAGLHRVPRTIFTAPDDDPLDKFYDQIAWFTGTGGVPALSMRYLDGGHYDFRPTALHNRGLTLNQLSWRVSDHYPLWVAFSLRD
jgi:endonuclease/exonuclease/phosphatase family metal-dependent hydrolase